MTTTTLAQRMKSYEHVYRAVLPRRTYMLMRLDGRSFSTYTRGLQRPYDAQFAADMDAAAIALCTEATGVALAYVQSDEMSLLLTDFGNEGTQPWLGGNVSKLLSLSAATVSVAFNLARPGKLATFDSRVFTLEDPAEVANYFVWRQRDAMKNSVTMAAGVHYSHAQLDALNTAQRQELLLEKGADWNELPEGFQRGRVITKDAREEVVSYVRGDTGERLTATAMRRFWKSEAAPLFSADPEGWLAAQIPVLQD